MSSSPISERTVWRWAVLAVVVLAFLFRLAPVVAVVTSRPDLSLANDSTSYLESARALRTAGRFSVSPEDPRPQVQRTPGYPIFLVPFVGTGKELPVSALFAQALISTLTVLMVVWLGSRLASTAVGVVAGALLALDFASISASFAFLTEAWFTFALIGFDCLAVKGPAEGRGLPWWFGLGLIAAFPALVRPVSYYYVLPVIGWCFMTDPQAGADGLLLLGRRSWTPVKRTIALGLGCLVTLGGWQVRNRVVSGTAVFSSIQGSSLLWFRGAGTLAAHEGVTLGAARESLGYKRYRELHPETAGLSDEALSKIWSREGLELVLRYPVASAKVWARGLIVMLFSPSHDYLTRAFSWPVRTTGPLGDFMREPLSEFLSKWVLGRPIEFLAFCFSELLLLCVYAGSLWSALTAFRARSLDPGWLLVILSLGYFLVVSAGPESYSRFRVPLAPLLAVTGSTGLVDLWTRWRACGREGAT